MHKQVHIHTWKQRCESARALAVSRHLLAACLCLSANRTSSEDIYHPAASSERQMTSQHLHSHLLTLFLLPPDHSCSPLHLLSTHLFLLLFFTLVVAIPLSCLSLSLFFLLSPSIFDITPPPPPFPDWTRTFSDIHSAHLSCSAAEKYRSW